MGRKLRLGAVVFLQTVPFLSFLCQDVWSFTPTLTPEGLGIRWRNQVRFNLSGSPQNQNGISDAEFQTAVVRGLQRWKAASGGAIHFDYWQGLEPRIYEPNSEYNGLSSIYFSSNETANESGLSPSVLGLTQVWYNTETGEILEADIVLNDRNFQFTTNVRDTSGYGTLGSGTGYLNGKTSVYIENVITHELGHAFGLSHSGGMQSSMIFMESPEQAFLGCDESIAVRSLYPSETNRLTNTVLTGRVLSPTGEPIFGAHLLAISRRRGTVIATALTDRDGTYRIPGLEAGVYYLLAEPFLAGAQALPRYYEGIRSHICEGQRPFSRTILMSSDVAEIASGNVGGYMPHEIVIRPEGLASIQAPDIYVKCKNYGGASVSGFPGSSRTETAPTLFDGSSMAGGFGAVDQVHTGKSTFFRLNHISGHLEIRVLGYSLYSPIDTRVELFDEEHHLVESSQLSDNVYVGESGFTNFDSALIVEDLPTASYLLKVSSNSLNSALFPAGPMMLDTVPFVVVTGSLNEASPVAVDRLPFNSRCRLGEEFPAYLSPSGIPPRGKRSASSGSDDEDGGFGFGFCGNLRANASGGKRFGEKEWINRETIKNDHLLRFTWPAVLGWFAPWLFVLFFGRLACYRWKRPLPYHYGS